MADSTPVNNTLQVGQTSTTTIVGVDQFGNDIALPPIDGQIQVTQSDPASESFSISANGFTITWTGAQQSAGDQITISGSFGGVQVSATMTHVITQAGGGEQPKFTGIRLVDVVNPMPGATQPAPAPAT